MVSASPRPSCYQPVLVPCDIFNSVSYWLLAVLFTSVKKEFFQIDTLRPPERSPTHILLLQFSGSHSGVVVDSVILRYDAAVLDNRFSTFKGTAFLRNGCNRLPSSTASYSKRTETLNIIYSWTQCTTGWNTLSSHRHSLKTAWRLTSSANLCSQIPSLEHFPKPYEFGIHFYTLVIQLFVLSE